MKDAPRGNGEHILYVDDEEPLVFLMQRVVERLGYRFTGFTDAPQALQAFRADPGAFDVVITDMYMPVLTGADLADQVRTLRPDVPVVLASGYGGGMEGDVGPAVFQATLRKPARAAEIGRLLYEVLH